MFVIDRDKSRVVHTAATAWRPFCRTLVDSAPDIQKDKEKENRL
jgi:hypothetical protein